MINIDAEDVNYKWLRQGRVEKGGLGSGVKGHTTPKAMADKYKGLLKSVDGQYFHLTDKPDVELSDEYQNTDQEFGRGLYLAASEDVKDWDRSLGGRDYIVPIDTSSLKVIREADMPSIKEMTNDLKELNVRGKDLETFKPTGDSFNRNPIDIAIKVAWSLVIGADAIIPFKDKVEGEQLIVFKPSTVKTGKGKKIEEHYKDLGLMKGGVGSGTKGHRTAKKKVPYEGLSSRVAEILKKYEYMEDLNPHQLEGFRKQIASRVGKAAEIYGGAIARWKKEHGDESFHHNVKGQEDMFTALKRIGKQLEGAFSDEEKKIAIDAAIHQAHMGGSGALFIGMLESDDEQESVNDTLNYIRDQRLHKVTNSDDVTKVYYTNPSGTISKGGTGSGFKGHKGRPGKKGGSSKGGGGIVALDDVVIPSLEASTDPNYVKRNEILKERERGLLGLDHEIGIVYTVEGEKLVEKVGVKNHVDFSDVDNKVFVGNIMTHNHHGSNASFSPKDITMAHVLNVREIRAVIEKGVYRFYRNDYDLFDEQMTGRVEMFFSRYSEKTFVKYKAKTDSGELTIDEAIPQMIEETWKKTKVAMNRVVKGDWGLDYKYVFKLEEW
jgi:hypothetical protein